MKKPTFVLLIAAALAWHLAGCSSTANVRAPHVMEPRVPFIVDLPEGHPLPIALYDPYMELSVEGLTATGVRQILGHPAERLGDNLWIYWRYYSPEKAARETDGHDTLVVAFENGKVSRMKLVSGDALRARLEHRSPSPVLVGQRASSRSDPGEKP